MKKIIALVTALSFLVTVPAFASSKGGSKAQSQSGADASVSQTFEGSNVPVQMNSYPGVTGPMIQQNNAPSGKDKHWNRVIKPWHLKTCWTVEDLTRLENNFSFYYPTITDKGTLQIFPFENLKGEIKTFTVVPVVSKENADKMYKLLAAASIFASDSETSYMQQWAKVVKANMKTVGAKFIMIIDEGSKEGSEAFGWHLGFTIGSNILNNAGTQGIGASIGGGVSDTQTKAEEYPNLTILFLDDLKPAPAVKK